MKRNSFFRNIYIWNLLGMIVVIIILVTAVLFGLNRYTQHGKAVEVPDIKGISIENAEPFLSAKDLSYIVIDSVFIKNAIPGTIFETTPPIGSNVKKGRTIYLKVVAFLPQLITVPDVKDSSQRQSLAILKSLGFENIVIKMVPGVYRELVLGLESGGEVVEAGQRIHANTPLSLLVSSGSGEIILLENPSDSIEVSLDESLF